LLSKFFTGSGGGDADSELAQYQAAPEYMTVEDVRFFLTICVCIHCMSWLVIDFLSLVFFPM
jgi:hypothetical protein